MSDALVRGQPRNTILLVTRNLPPLRGGMERLNRHIAIELQVDFQICVVGPEGCRVALPDGIKVHEAPARPLWRFLPQAMIQSLRLARQFKPRVVLAGSGLTAPIAVLAAWLAGGRSALYAHGLDLAVRHRLYRALWLPFLRRCDLCIVNSHHTKGLAVAAGIKPERITIIHPGVSLPEVGRSSSAEEFRERYDLSDREILLSVGRLTPRKGLREFVREALPEIVRRHPNAVLLVIGDEAPDALNGAGTGAAIKVQTLARDLGLEQHLLMVGACSDATLTAAYAAADVCVFPLRQIPGDVEGFGMVAIEAAAHGLATVAFDVGGVADAVADGRSGWLVPAGDYTTMVERIGRVLLTRRSVQTRMQARAFAEAFDWTHFGSTLRRNIRQLIAGEAT
ncbi:glycosyltransferase family 4 protein [Rhodanobacter sp. Col0626]|uniref:glycosyltransferase family 4 protein n=1 Tax=Rhodanobacter sp. Col0626 TaxID=3415679 RepID=UPI003CE8D6D6